MSIQTPSAAEQKAEKGYVVLPPEVEPAVKPIFSAGFVIFSIFVITLATVGGLVMSGKMSLNQFFGARKGMAPAVSEVASGGSVVAPVIKAVSPVIAAIIPKAVRAPAAPLPSPDTFKVTSISMGDPSIAIINGISHAVGDEVNAPGVSGWKVKQIGEDAVVLENGSTDMTVPLSMDDGLKPLDDGLHPLN